jgi:indole-3-glycerol phosphate synthase
VSGVLDDIVAAVRARLAARPAPSDLEERARSAAAARAADGRRSLRAALAAPGVRIIAECKRRSPSAGVLRNAFDPVELARLYERGGAAAVSVVTEPDFFAGDPAWIAAIRGASSLSVLRKDFIVGERQLFESVTYGADAVLLLARLLDDARLSRLLVVCGELGLEALVETHDEGELERALATPARLVGVNARDLRTFEVDVTRAAELARRVPDERIAIVESGIAGPGTVAALVAAGVRRFLVGEYLLRSGDPAAALKGLVGCG